MQGDRSLTDVFNRKLIDRGTTQVVNMEELPINPSELAKWNSVKKGAPNQTVSGLSRQRVSSKQLISAPVNAAGMKPPCRPMSGAPRRK